MNGPANFSLIVELQKLVSDQMKFIQTWKDQAGRDARTTMERLGIRAASLTGCTELLTPFEEEEGKTTLRSVLMNLYREADPWLLDDGARDWDVSNLLDALDQADDPAYLDQEVVMTESVIFALDENGYQKAVPIYRFR